MLSGIGRAATRRVSGTTTFSSSGRVKESSWRLQRVVIAQNYHNDTQAHSSRQAHSTLYLKRSFATDTKPSDKPRAKKAVNAKASSATEGASTKPKAKKKPVKKPAKKPKKKPAKKVAAKRKPAIKKELSEEQKVKLAQKKATLKVQALKKAALLSTPKQLPSLAWSVYLKEEFKKHEGVVDFKSVIPTIAAQFRNISASEREHYNHVANQNKAANEAAYNDWVASFTPDQIRLANTARSSLRQMSKHPRSLSSLKDPRQPKRPLSARSIFFQQKAASGDLKGIPFIDLMKSMNDEWKELPAQEKERIEAESVVDRERYEKEYRSVYNRPTVSSKAKSQAST